MAFSNADLADLINVTLDELGRSKWTDLSFKHQRYFALPEIMRKERVAMEGGTGIQWTVTTKHSGAAHATTPYAEDAVAVADVTQLANIPWRHVTTNWAIDRLELAQNKGAARIVQLIKMRRADALTSLAELLESYMWSKPVDSTDTITPFGLFYYMVPNATAGFNGGNPTGFAAGAGGIDSSTYTRWANWTDQYTEVTHDDLIRKMRKAHFKTRFRAPHATPGFERGAPRQVIYGQYDDIALIEEVGEKQNDRLGKDVASMDGIVTFRGSPMEKVPELEDQYAAPVGAGIPTNGILFVDWSEIYPAILSGEYLNESGPKQSPKQHTVMEVHVDLTLNFCCKNRRPLAVIQKSS